MAAKEDAAKRQDEALLGKAVAAALPPPAAEVRHGIKAVQQCCCISGS
jgi:hypothetical protein